MYPTIDENNHEKMPNQQKECSGKLTIEPGVSSAMRTAKQQSVRLIRPIYLNRRITHNVPNEFQYFASKSKDLKILITTEHTCVPGEIIVVPRDAKYQFRNDGNKPIEIEH